MFHRNIRKTKPHHQCRK